MHSVDVAKAAEMPVAEEDVQRGNVGSLEYSAVGDSIGSGDGEMCRRHRMWNVFSCFSCPACMVQDMVQSLCSARLCRV